MFFLQGTYLDLFYGIDPSYLKALQIRKKDQKSKVMYYL